jgi:hypothetical protein
MSNQGQNADLRSIKKDPELTGALGFSVSSGSNIWYSARL